MVECLSCKEDVAGSMPAAGSNFNNEEEENMSGYTAHIEDGREIYIPSWPVNVQLQNLTEVSKVFGPDSVVAMAKLELRETIKAVMNAEDAEKSMSLIKHFIQQVRIDGNKVTAETMDDMFEDKLRVVLELFTHLIHSQYNGFFD